MEKENKNSASTGPFKIVSEDLMPNYEASPELIIYHLTRPDLRQKERKRQIFFRRELRKLRNEQDMVKKEYIENYQLKAPVPDADVQIQHIKGQNQKDLYDVIENAEKELRKEEIHIKEYIRQSTNLMEENRRVWDCFNVLSDESRDVLYKLHTKNEKWETVEMELNINHSTLVRIRQTAIKEIIRLYNSDLTTRELISMHYHIKSERSKSGHSSRNTKNKETITGQMSLFN